MPRKRETRSGIGSSPVVSSLTARAARSDTNWPPSVAATDVDACELCADAGVTAPATSAANAAAITARFIAYSVLPLAPAEYCCDRLGAGYSGLGAPLRISASRGWREMLRLVA